MLVLMGDAVTDVTVGGCEIKLPPSGIIGASLGPKVHNSCCWMAIACAAAKAACFIIGWLGIPGFVEEDRGWILGMVVRNAVG